jgi:TPR repeat protein
VTDRDTESTIAELSRYEVRNLPRAANYGDDEAAFQLGMLYELGLGFTQNCAKAAEWVTKAAQAGNPAAEYNLALRYRDGDGVTPNPQEADLWLRKANAHKNLPPDHELAALPAQPPASVRQ